MRLAAWHGKARHLHNNGGFQMKAGRVTEIEVDTTRPRPFYTARSLALRLDISERTVRDMLKRGVIPSYRVEGARRIDPADVEEYLRARREREEA